MKSMIGFFRSHRIIYGWQDSDATGTTWYHLVFRILGYAAGILIDRMGLDLKMSIVAITIDGVDIWRSSWIGLDRSPCRRRPPRSCRRLLEDRFKKKLCLYG